MTEQQAREAKDSAITLQQLMLPEHANQLGVVHGGIVMKAADEAGAICAMRHTRRTCVTVCVDSMEFHSPVQVGQLLRCHAKATWTGRTSIEVCVNVEAEDIIAGQVTQTNSAYIVYVAIDGPGHPAAVTPLLVKSDEERRMWADALVRQQERLKRKR